MTTDTQQIPSSGVSEIEPNPSGQPSDIRDLMSGASPDGTEKTPPDIKGASEQKADPLRTAEDAPAPVPDWAEGVPEHLRGETIEETLQKTAAAHQGLRAKLSKGQASDIPDAADKYEWALPEKYLEAAGGEVSDDPIIAKFAEIAHAKNIGQADANEMINGVLEVAIENGLIEPTMSMEAYWNEFGDEAAGTKIAQDTAAWTKNMLLSGKFGEIGTDLGRKAAEAIADSIYDMAAQSPNALKALNYIRTAQKAPGMVLPASGDNDTAALTSSNLQKEVADPRYNTSSPDFDPEYRKRVDARHAEFDKSR